METNPVVILLYRSCVISSLLSAAPEKGSTAPDTSCARNLCGRPLARENADLLMFASKN